MLTAKQNGGLLIVRDGDGHIVRKLNAVAVAKDYLELGEAAFYRKYGFRFCPHGHTLAEAVRQTAQKHD